MNDRTDTARLNPLLDFSDLPRFDAITPEAVGPAIDELLAEANAALETVTADSFAAQWRAMSASLDVATERLSRAWGAVSHLNSVADTPELRAAYNAALPRVTEFWTRLGSDERLYAKYKAIDAANLNTEQKQAQKNALRGFVLGGAELQGAAKERYAAIQERLAEITQKFSENTLDATDKFALYVSEDQLKGVPADVVQATRDAAQKEGKEGHRLSLKMPVYLPVMQFADSGALRLQCKTFDIAKLAQHMTESFETIMQKAWSSIQEKFYLRTKYWLTNLPMPIGKFQPPAPWFRCSRWKRFALPCRAVLIAVRQGSPR